MSKTEDQPIDRFFAGELSRAEQRDLAQAALDDPQLFERITEAALVKIAVQHQTAIPLTGRFNPRLRWTVAALTAAAALVVVIRLAGPGPGPTATPAPVGSAAQPTGVAAAPELTLLSARLETAAAPSTFRAADTPSRLPRGVGRVVAVQDGVGTVDVGAVDGVVQGVTLRKSDSAGTATPPRLIATTVFRDRARGTIAGGPLLVGDRVRVPASAQVDAWLAQSDARLASGDRAAALRHAERALAVAAEQGVRPDVRRRALTRLGLLEHAAGVLDRAATHLRQAADAAGQATPAGPLEHSAILDALATTLLESGRPAEAEAALQSGRTIAAGAAGVRILNNLATLAARRGDRASAQTLYESALALGETSPALADDREAVASNLAHLRAGR